MAEHTKGIDKDKQPLERNRPGKSGSSNSEHEDASATRGGISDMDHRAERDASGNVSRNNSGSGISTKNTVTGSDFDGQLSDL